MTETTLVERLHKLLKSRIAVGITVLENGYQLQLLRLFEEADDADCLLWGDALWNRLEDRYPDDVKDSRYVALFKQVQVFWDAWHFYRDNYRVSST